MSIFSYEQTFKEIQDGAQSIPLICLKCKHNMAVTNYQSFGCQQCQTRYTFESYQLQFNSMFMSLLLNNGVGGASTQTQTSTTLTTETKPLEVTTPDNIPRKPPVIDRPPISMKEFEHIYSFGDIKQIFIDAVNNPDPTHICLLSGPGQGKTVFIKAVAKYYGSKGKFVSGQSLTKSGITDLLIENPHLEAIFIDEIDKSDEKNQMPLLGVMSDQQINELKYQRDRSAKLNIRVFATCNDFDKLYPALIDRFFFVHMEKYTKEQFYEIASMILATRYKDKFSTELQVYMLDTFYNSMKKVSMRDLVDKVAKLSKPTKESIDFYINTINKYTNENLL